ncbi:unnamed protein product [Clavelina lepadiformis]|uniref:non-specific serine/threonine protein kinase n=1 Tax=Clavelina lepadiformis TaxID=159417 RepID=A0ABP0GLI1_CLALP
MDAETNSMVVGQRNYDHKTWSEKDTLRTRGYILRDTLGEGTYSKVKRACSVRLQRDVAIKIICREKAPEVFEKKFLPREIEILSFVKHARIIRVYEIFETKVPGRVYIVTELLNSKDLLEYVKVE